MFFLNSVDGFRVVWTAKFFFGYVGQIWSIHHLSFPSLWFYLGYSCMKPIALPRCACCSVRVYARQCKYRTIYRPGRGDSRWERTLRMLCRSYWPHETFSLLSEVRSNMHCHEHFVLLVPSNYYLIFLEFFVGWRTSVKRDEILIFDHIILRRTAHMSFIGLFSQHSLLTFHAQGLYLPPTLHWLLALNCFRFLKPWYLSTFSSQPILSNCILFRGRSVDIIERVPPLFSMLFSGRAFSPTLYGTVN